MSDNDKPEVKPTNDDKSDVGTEETPAGSSPAKPALKILGKQEALDPKAQKEWDNQPSVVKKDGEEEPKGKPAGEPKEPDRVASALEKEKARVAARREAILAEIKQGKAENRTLAAEPEPEPVDDDGWKVVDEKIEQRLQRVEAQRDFFTSKPDFYTGDEGKANREVLLQYVAAHFKEVTPAAMQMAHHYIYGAMDTDIAVREAKRQQTSTVLAHKAAVLGSAKGTSTSGAPAPQRKRILPKATTPADWY